MTAVALMDMALREARDTYALRLGAGVRHDAGEFFKDQFGAATAVIVSDASVFAVLGPDIAASFERAGVGCGSPFLFADPKLYAADQYVQELQQHLSRREGLPVSLGAGSINDITKLVAHRLGRPYLAIASAASMDGYTAFGSSITKDGLKQTFDCPAPRAVLADTESIAAAPAHLTAAGYGDLAAKLTAGADWIVADALGVEPIDPPAWEMVQSRLREWLEKPAAVARGDQAAIGSLTIGLMMGGFAMQRTKTSRPASGAEHQFSHLWDMQNHTHEGAAPSHGFKVAIGTLASTALYEALLVMPLETLDIDGVVSLWPDRAAAVAEARTELDSPAIQECGQREVDVKYVEAAALRDQLTRMQSGWPVLRDRLKQHLIPFSELRSMLHAAGCPTRPEQIGISRERLRRSYRQAYYIRRRFTVLDLAMRAGLFEICMNKLFAAGGAWEPLA